MSNSENKENSILFSSHFYLITNCDEGQIAIWVYPENKGSLTVLVEERGQSIITITTR